MAENHFLLIIRPIDQKTSFQADRKHQQRPRVTRDGLCAFTTLSIAMGQLHVHLCRLYFQHNYGDLCSMPDLKEETRRITNSSKRSRPEPIDADLLRELEPQMFSFHGTLTASFCREKSMLSKDGFDQITKIILSIFWLQIIPIEFHKLLFLFFY